ncbi:hypothetical protein [Erwinia tasmaniensis]|uniref:Uncharacterized protein n=1 Tax=Erwinia tasmaniensis (strain DSM 17950 / CFBP 7177 / CIP 109463 / NCPPB 4357 / Et1/99) TaxID=465817 RepID=B2VEF3_ERWT9|nr:hypothetical protein [Erwinia tasmaniensis]CAO96949.1 hypothetical protein ETA_19030 [Erwinia tasmaniensis Et1/99]
MDAWSKGRQLTVLLDYRKTAVERQIFMVKKTLSEINLSLEEKHERYNSINKEIKSLTPCGVFHRTDIYKNIRRQGVLLSQQQYLSHEIKRLEDNKAENEQMLQEGVNVRNALEKKSYKLFGYFHKQHVKFIVRSENNIEHEHHETFLYGRAKH